MEGGPAYSASIRSVLHKYYGIEVGCCSYWPWRQKPLVLHRGTRIGNYCYVANTVRTFTRNHPFHLLSSHGLFYNPELGRVTGPPVCFGKLDIEHGAWVGDRAIILPPAHRIGIGAVVRPGSIVCMDVPDYAIVDGFPARIVGWRVDKSLIPRLISSRWWEQAIVDLGEGRLEKWSAFNF